MSSAIRALLSDRPRLKRWAFGAGSVLVATVVSWAVVATQPPIQPVEVEVGAPSPDDFYAVEPIEVTDVRATEAARRAAREKVSDVFVREPESEESAYRFVADVFAAVIEGAEPVAPTTTTTTTTTPPPTTTAPPAADLTPLSVPQVTSTTTTTTTTIPLPQPPPLSEQVEALSEKFPTLDAETIQVLVANSDYADALADATVIMLERAFESGVRSDTLDAVRSSLVTSPPFVVLPSGIRNAEAARLAAARVAAAAVQPNERHDEAATEAAREEASAAVNEVRVSYAAGELVVSRGQRVTDVQYEVISAQGLNRSEADPVPKRRVLVVLLAATAVVLSQVRGRAGLVYSPRRAALAAFSFVLSALAVRLVLGVAPAWMLAVPLAAPALAVGVLAGRRPGLTHLVSTAVLALVAGTASAPLAASLVGGAAGMLTIGDAEDRRHLNVGLARMALAYGTAVAFVGAGFAWGSGSMISMDAAVAGVAAALVCLGMLAVSRPLFGVTTVLDLFDLADRNHPALRHLESSAPGTYHHSLLVGSLAEAAARRIGARTVLARVGAYYHDIGKTENPTMFAENQFGAHNPHDLMDPRDSAEVIRRHVTDGVRLARRFRLPPEVIDVIGSHHGCSVMRYFHSEAVRRAEAAGAPRPDDAAFRHTGPKPQSKEAAIVMLADACEAAVRSLVRQDAPTTERVSSLVDAVVSEKLNDGQLDDSGLTLGDVVEVKSSLVETLVTYYHDRVVYPHFEEDTRSA